MRYYQVCLTTHLLVLFVCLMYDHQSRHYCFELKLNEWGKEWNKSGICGQRGMKEWCGSGVGVVWEWCGSGVGVV